MSLPTYIPIHLVNLRFHMLALLHQDTYALSHIFRMLVAPHMLLLTSPASTANAGVNAIPVKLPAFWLQKPRSWLKQFTHSSCGQVSRRSTPSSTTYLLFGTPRPVTGSVKWPITRVRHPTLHSRSSCFLSHCPPDRTCGNSLTYQM